MYMNTNTYIYTVCIYMYFLYIYCIYMRNPAVAGMYCTIMIRESAVFQGQFCFSYFVCLCLCVNVNLKGHYTLD